jgi:hypothetical protein
MIISSGGSGFSLTLAIDYEPLKQMLMTIVPFNRHVGIEILAIGPGAASRPTTSRSPR